MTAQHRHAPAISSAPQTRGVTRPRKDHSGSHHKRCASNHAWAEVFAKHHLAKAIAVTCAVLDPQRVILGGALGRNFDVLRKPLQRSLALVTPLEIELVATALGDAAVLRGAIAIAQAPARAPLFELRTGTEPRSPQ